MKVRQFAAALVVVSSVFAVAGVAQANCHKETPGWHMVSKKCPIGPAANWQQYQSGVYTQPMAKSLF